MSSQRVDLCVAVAITFVVAAWGGYVLRQFGAF